MTDLAGVYYKELLENCLPFWQKYSPDKECGGYFTCLDRYGRVYDTDKFIWLQARQVWMFSYLYEKLDKRWEWVETARIGMEFLEKYGRDEAGNFYFSVDRSGKPLVKPYNIFSDCFAAMAYYQYGRSIDSSRHQEEAQGIFENILKRQSNPKGIFEKNTGTRPLKDFALPMILSNLVLLLEPALGATEVEKTIIDCKNVILDHFYDTETGLIHEYVLPDGEKSNTFNGRLINPGHVLEAMWFLMDIGEYLGDRELIDRCIRIGLHHLEYGWDPEYGGIFYFMDSMAKPPEKLEWDRKLWWVHLEALVFLTKSLCYSKEMNLSIWFEKVHQYTWSHFQEEGFGEWYGYLNRRGEPLMSLKGSKWKGCFHVPRGLYHCWINLLAKK